jgi:superfamily II DNA/RNA helicase
MLDLGFLPDIERILRQIPQTRQSMLFSATMPDPIITLARSFMNQPTHIRAESPQASAVHTTTDQFAYRAHALDKVELVSRILQVRDRGATMVFTRTKRTAQKVSDELAERGFKVGAVHGDLNQGAREKALKALRTGGIDVLVATDVAARGIDIDDVTHVINYQCPEDEQAYVHRIGRTGRAGKTGVAITLIDWDEIARWQMIDKALGLGHPDPAETYSSSPHLFEELDIPTDATGKIGPARAAKTAKRPPRDAAETPARPRTKSRRRTRGGKPVSGHPQGEKAAELSENGDQPAADGDGTARKRRRRRPRKAAAASCQQPRPITDTGRPVRPRVRFSTAANLSACPEPPSGRPDPPGPTCSPPRRSPSSSPPSPP